MAERVFQGIEKPIIYRNNQHYDHVINRWAAFIRKQHRKGLIPLFITGLGVSKGKEKNKIPDVYGIVDQLKEEFHKDTKGKEEQLSEIEDLFETLNTIRQKKQKDRGTIARLLSAFQARENLREEWESLNDWLLRKILRAKPTTFHKKLAELYEKFDAVNITLNFDGLLIREFEINRKPEKEKFEKAFSLPTKEECENFFLRPLGTKNTVKEYLEIQIRGDILYVVCDSNGFCPQKDKLRPLWSSIASYPKNKETEKGETIVLNQSDDKNKLDKLVESIRKCPSCGKKGISYLSFPGSYDKEKDMKDMLAIVWKCLVFRVGSVTVVGTSAEWDPLMIAFLGDLLSERGIPLLVVDRYPKGENVRGDEEKPKTTYIIKELVYTKVHGAQALGVTADQFMKDLTEKLPPKRVQINNIAENKSGYTNDKYWDKMIKNTLLKGSINLKHSHLESNVRKKIEKTGIDKFAQLGLKSYWLGINYSDKAKYHTRFNHSIGVMKVASYLYDKVIENAGLEKNDYEKQFLRLAALLHDVGHLPFSHLIENVFNELNWKPAGYKDHYSHVFQTDKEIEEIFSDNKLRVQLENTGYDVEDIIKLVNGSFGVSYLDAIINSSIDADKIDYVFRDTSSTERKTSLAPVQFLKDIVNGLSITPEKYLSFSGVSAMAAVGLLRERQRLYRSLYLQPGIVVLEGIVKLIIKTYFVHSIELDDPEIIGEMKPNDNDYPDLGEYKISYCVKKLQEIFNEVKKNNDTMYEIKIVEEMFEEIKIRENILGKKFFKNIEKGFNVVCDTNDSDVLQALERKITHKRFNDQKIKIKEIIRDVMFRMPGAAEKEVTELKSFPNV
jgi:HD superfamily phosphohydrolase